MSMEFAEMIKQDDWLAKVFSNLKDSKQAQTVTTVTLCDALVPCVKWCGVYQGKDKVVGNYAFDRMRDSCKVKLPDELTEPQLLKAIVSHADSHGMQPRIHIRNLSNGFVEIIANQSFSTAYAMALDNMPDCISNAPLTRWITKHARVFECEVDNINSANGDGHE